MEPQCRSPPYLGMDPKHVQQIYRCMDQLINETDFKKLARACLERGLLTQAMINKIEAGPNEDRIDHESEQRKRHRRLFEKLTKRGPDAYQELKIILSENGFYSALDRLKDINKDDENWKSIREDKRQHFPLTRVTREPLPTVQEAHVDGNSSTKLNHEGNLKLQPYTEEIQPSKMHVVIKSSELHVGDKVGVYPMCSKNNRGVLFMVNIVEFKNSPYEYRKGAKEDSASMLHLFKELNFKLYAYENLNQYQFFDLLKQLIQSDDVRQTECFVMVLMTHGNMDNNGKERVLFTDGSVVYVQKILNHFTNKECVNLANKPKIFLFPFCRGSDYDLGHVSITTQTDSIIMAPDPLPFFSDSLICYATIRGYRSHRDPDSGSWYIKSFYKLMAEHAHNTHFEDILKMIQHETGKLKSDFGSMQAGTFENASFNKKLYFNPGFHAE